MKAIYGNSTLSISFFLLTIIFLASCEKLIETPENAPPPKTGTLTIEMARSSIPAEVFQIDVRLERFGYKPIVDSVMVASTVDTLVLRIPDVPIGEWDIAITAKDSIGKTKYVGQSSVAVLDGQVSRVRLKLDPVGSIEIEITWNNPSARWVMYPNNPVIQQASSSGDFYHFYIIEADVLKIGNEYKMWYTGGTNYLFGDTTAVCYATSSDGILWTKHGAVLTRGSSGSWNERGSNNPSVLYEGGSYRMWFEGEKFGYSHNGIGFATSTDGIHWNVTGLPIMSPSAQKPRLGTPTIVKRSGIYYLYYSVEHIPPPNLLVEIWLATSTDAVTWIDRGAVLQKRPGILWEENGPSDPAVVYTGNRFEMYYTSNGQGTRYIGKAESVDGIHWTFSSTEPELKPNDTINWTVKMIGHPSVILDSGKRKMWFSGLNQSPEQWRIGYAER